MTLVLNERKKLHCVFTCCFHLSCPEVLLSGEINLKVSLKGFPTPVTSALSMPSPQRSDRYEHYVFSGRKRHQSALFLIEHHHVDSEPNIHCICCVSSVPWSFWCWNNILSSLQLSSSESRFQVTYQRWPSPIHLQSSHPYPSSALLLWQLVLPIWRLRMLTPPSQAQPTLSQCGCAVHRNTLNKRKDRGSLLVYFLHKI